MNLHHHLEAEGKERIANTYVTSLVVVSDGVVGSKTDPRGNGSAKER